MKNDMQHDAQNDKLQECRNAGMQFSEKLQNCIPAKLQNVVEDDWEDDSEDDPPCLQDQVYENLPSILKEVVSLAPSNRDRDVLLLGTLATISVLFPKCYALYDLKIVYPNLYFFLTAAAGVGKGSLTLCRKLVEPEHKRLIEESRQARKAFRDKLAEQKQNKEGDVFSEPPLKMLIFPANSSSSALVKALYDNDGCGLIFETEGDTLSQTINKDFGGYSDILRKAFHHEPVSQNRRTNQEYFEIPEPKLSVVLAGTPAQIGRLIPNAEDGLMSRFLFYRLPFDATLRNVFQTTDKEQSMDERFRVLGEKLDRMIGTALSFDRYRFQLRKEHQDSFMIIFEAIKNWCLKVDKGLLGTVRRIGLIGFKIMMILTILRELDEPKAKEAPFDGKDILLECTEPDFWRGIQIMQTLIHHSIFIFKEMQSREKGKEGNAKMRKKNKLYDALPDNFTKSDYVKISDGVGLNPSTTERWLDQYLRAGRLVRVAQGKYEKTTKPP